MVPTSCCWSVYSLTKMLLFRKAFVIPESSPTERIGPYGDFKFAVLPSSSPRSGSVMTLLNVNDSFVKAPAIYYRQLNMKRRPRCKSGDNKWRSMPSLVSFVSCRSVGVVILNMPIYGNCTSRWTAAHIWRRVQKVWHFSDLLTKLSFWANITK